MDPRRTTFVGGIALVVIVSLAAGNFLLWPPDGQHRGRSPWTTEAAVAEHPRPAVPPLATEAGSQSSLAAEPLRIDDRHFSPLRPVDATTDLDGAPPQSLAVTADATPLHNAGTLPDHEILALIDEELPGASDVEREVWLEELRDVAPETMRRILRLWREQHASVRVMEELLPPPPVSVPACCADGRGNVACSDGELHDTALFALDAGLDHDQLISRVAPSLEAFGQARDVILNNVANAGTIGFKRSDVLFGEAGTGGAGVVHCQDGEELHVVVGFVDRSGAGADLAEVRLDMSPGRIQRTGRPFDVAIAGAGFLQVRSGDELLLTRTGRLTRAEGGLLAVTAARGTCPLEPPVVVTDEVAELKITRDGVVLVRLAGQEEPFEAGRILIARCADASALAPRGGSLFAPTAASGTPQAGTPGNDGLGTLRQGALEQSNVDLEQEAAAFRQLQARVTVLSQIVSEALPFAAARPMQIVAAPPAEEPETEFAVDGGPALGREPGLIDEYLETRQAGRDAGPELR